MTSLLEALGATVVPFNAADKCCGSYQVLNGPDGAQRTAAAILKMRRGGRDRGPGHQLPALRIQSRQTAGQMLAEGQIDTAVPTYYFTQLLAVALGVAPESCRFDLNDEAAVELLKNKNCLVAA